MSDKAANSTIYPEIKICGIKDHRSLLHCGQLDVTYVGFVFFEKSPRHLEFEQARALCDDCPGSLKKVGLFINPTRAQLESAIELGLDYIQLHGQENPDFCAMVENELKRPVIKALGVSSAKDLERAQDYQGSITRLLLDAKPPKGADLPGGNALSFDWRLLENKPLKMPFLLAGGLTPKTVCQGLSISGAIGVDVSSGVESKRGVKSLALITEFCANARKAEKTKATVRVKIDLGAEFT